MNSMNANNNFSIIMQNFANDLYEKDEDKIITKQEISQYLNTIKNDAEFVSLNISTSQAEAELDKLLNSDSSDKTKSSDETTVFEDLEAAKARIGELEELIKSYDERKVTLHMSLEQMLPELEQAQKLCDELSERTKAQQEKYKSLEKKAQNKNKEYEELMKSVEKMQQQLVEDTKNRQQDALKKAESEYDPAKDGSWEDFAQKYLDDVASSPLQGQLNTLMASLKDLSSALSSLASNMKSTASDLETTQDKLNSQAQTTSNLSGEYNAALTELNDIDGIKESATAELNEKTKMTANSVLNLVSKEELALVQENNLDLKEQLPSGGARYIFALGDADNEYHIYDMAQGGRSVGDMYSTMHSVVPYGSGIMGDFNILGNDSDKGRKIYYFNECGDLKCDKACYETYDPLCLDINGDGVKTSSKVIDYDIDGDGVKDKINDAADAVLVFDKDGDGISGTDGSECFGNSTDLDGDGKADGYKDGFEALKALAKKEGLIGENDSVLDEKDLKTLEEKYGLKIKTEGYNSKAESLADVGITEINLADTDETTMLDNFDGNGNQLMKQQGATFKINGEIHEYADIWHRKLDETESSNATNSKTFNPKTFANFEIDEEVLNFKASNDILRKISSNQSKAQGIVKNGTDTKDSVQIDRSFGDNMEAEIEKEEDEKKKKEEKLNPFG